MRHHLNLNWLRSFEAAARLLSFTTASRELGLTQTAISQHIKALELKLGQKLFVRRPKSLQLTDVGKAYLISVREALETIEMSTYGLFGPNLKSTVVVRASMAFILWLSPRLGAFQEQHPDVGIKLVTSLWDSKADKQPRDLDIVLAPQEYARPHLEKLSDEFILPICGATSAESVRTPYDLLRHRPIHILGFDDHWTRYLTAFGLSYDVSSVRLTVDTSVAATEMVAADLGCAIVLERFAKQTVQTGRAIRIAGDPVVLGQSYYMSQGETHKKLAPAIEAFAEWLRAQF